MYENRTTAGGILGEELAGQDIRPDVVLAIPAGGVNVARPICERFDADLGLMVSQTIRTPSTKDLPVGAVTDTGVTWIDENVVEAFEIDDETLEIEQQRAFRDARDKHEIYEDAVADPTPAGTVAIVGEGIINGMRMKACLSAVDRIEGAEAVPAAPIGTPDAVAELHAWADEVVLDQTITDSKILGRYYDQFGRPVVPQESPSE